MQKKEKEDALEAEYNIAHNLIHPNILHYERLVNDPAYGSMVLTDLCNGSLSSVLEQIGAPTKKITLDGVCAHLIYEAKERNLSKNEEEIRRKESWGGAAEYG